MTNILTQIKIRKILSTSTVAGISLMLFASIFSAIPTSSASSDPCEIIFGADVAIFDSNSVFDSDTGEFISVFKCFESDIDCSVNDPNPVNSVEEVPKKSATSSTCDGFGVIMLTNVEGAVLTDSVPAEWDVNGFADGSGSCTEDVKGKNSQGATVYTCTAVAGGLAPFWAAFAVSTLDTRESPSNNKNPNHEKPDKYKPTSCEPLFKNEGAEGFVPDDTFMNGFVNSDLIVATVTPFSTGLTDKIEVTVDGCID